MLLFDNLFLTLRALKNDVRQIFPRKPAFSEASLSRALEGELVSLKLPRDLLAERNSERIKAVRKTSMLNGW